MYNYKKKKNFEDHDGGKGITPSVNMWGQILKKFS